MKIAIATSFIMILSTFAVVSGYLSLTSNEKSESLDTVLELREKDRIQIKATNDRQKKPMTELPDYHPEDYVEVEEGLDRVQKPAVGVTKTIGEVESSLAQRISLLDQHLDDPDARASLRAALSSPEMEAYKQAILWKVKHETADLP